AVQPDRVVPHHDCGKHWSDLRDVVSYCGQHGAVVELLSTESCLLGCTRRNAHYQHLAAQGVDSAFHTVCNSIKLLRPREFLLAGGCIRPEDIRLFVGMGVQFFKLSGRSKPARWLPEVAAAYQAQRYDGNLVRLLGIDPSLQAESWVYINNRALDGFMAGYPQSGRYGDEVAYADEWIVRLHKSGDFKLNDGTTYREVNGSLQLESPGHWAAKVLRREQVSGNRHDDA
ncbi:MAG: hypothetical protein V1916_02655, partial [Patescibacteria group bacterium]